MQQQGDSIFIYIFDNNKVGVIWEIDIALTSLKACTINNRSLSVEAIWLFTKNSLKQNFNNERLMKLNYPLIEVLEVHTISPPRWNPPWRGEGAYLTKRFSPHSTSKARWSDAATSDKDKQICFMLMPRTWFKVEEFRLE